LAFVIPLGLLTGSSCTLSRAPRDQRAGTDHSIGNLFGEHDARRALTIIFTSSPRALDLNSIAPYCAVTVQGTAW